MTLRLEDASVRIGKSILLDSVNISIEPGKVVALAGPNGAGKSTALAALSGDRRLWKGHALVNGCNVDRLSARQQAEVRAVMRQHMEVGFSFTARDIVEMGMLAGSMTGRNRLVFDAMEEADVGYLADRSVTSLSGGERQRVSLARALVQLHSSPYRDGARFLLMDEPTSSLDIAHQIAVMETARNAAGKGFGVLCVLHDLNLAARFADWLYVLKSGRIAVSGKPGEIISQEMVRNVYAAHVRVLEEGDRRVVAFA